MRTTKNTYKKSGVNIKLADRFVDYIANISKKMSKKGINTWAKTILEHLAQHLT